MEYARVCCGFSFVDMVFPPAIFVEDHRKKKSPCDRSQEHPIVSKIIVLWLAAIVAIATILVFEEESGCPV